MVQKQTLYIAILIAVTFGFMVGAVYTSFKLAKEGPSKTASMPPQAGQQAQSADVQMAARILELEEFLKKNPEDAKAWTQLGNIFYDTNRVTDAIEAYGRSLELAPGNPMVLTDLGVMHRRNQSPEKAIEYFDLAIQANPDFETARFNKGIVLMHDLNNLDAAIQVWEELLEINPMAEAPNGQLVGNLIQGLKEKQ